MNILHHKSWHVRNKDNIERVRRDEAKAAEEEKEKLRKVALAEQEARTDLLRQRARGQKVTFTSSSTVTSPEKIEGAPVKKDEDEEKTKLDVYNSNSLVSDIYTGSGGHMNFFKDTEGVSTGKHNIDHEAEKKAEKEDWEKKMGILTYLGQSSLKSEGGSAPWYAKKRKREEDEDDTISKREHNDKKLKDSLDPIHKLNGYLKKKSRKDKHQSDKYKHKHQKPKHKKDKERSVESSKAAKVQGSKSMEQLRAERHKREAAEKRKAAALMAKVRGEKTEEEKEEEKEVSDRDRRYNSQYNPDFVRKPRKHSH
ncbi:leukocyte receptor cluster member 1 homolog [Mizuhopecten yessoensis]|uniref:leukocyte receptor cluster member 1 homolog n=1 Tax=Mizuhopecten yessoensis TaxID=6573 RepID=UPI000B45D6A1|nr:leukocyte receptor cluster member 1 homolog [Mizuhopecten yessoensis]